MRARAETYDLEATAHKTAPRAQKGATGSPTRLSMADPAIARSFRLFSVLFCRLTQNEIGAPSFLDGRNNTVHGQSDTCQGPETTDSTAVEQLVLGA
jgi:hypothetical protein